VTPAPASSLRRLIVVSAVSGIYDTTLGLTLLLGRELLVRLFGVPPPVPPIHSDLNGVFLLAVGLGYVLPYRRPDVYRGYLWVMGPFLKGAGALAFVVDHALRHSPTVFLAFAVTDGALALLTLWALVTTRERR